MLYWKNIIKNYKLQIEISPLYGMMLGINYAYYPPEVDVKEMHLVQIAAGLVMIQVAWEI